MSGSEFDIEALRLKQLERARIELAVDFEIRALTNEMAGRSNVELAAKIKKLEFENQQLKVAITELLR